MDKMTETLRHYELRLLRCTLNPSRDSFPLSSDIHLKGIHASLDHLITLIEEGEYLSALSSDAAKMFLIDFHEVPGPPEHEYSNLVGNSLDKFLDCDGDEEEAYRVLLVLAIAVAAFLCFTQRNLTGPLNEFPACPLLSRSLEDREYKEFEAWAHRQLTADGSHLVGKLYNLQYIAFTKILVVRLKDWLNGNSNHYKHGLRTVSWWLVRVLFVVQRILDEISSSLFDLLQVHTANAICQFETIEKVNCYWGASLRDGEAMKIVSLLYLEAGVIQHTYGRVDACRNYIRSAEGVAKLELSVTGVLGYRTIHQQEPKAVKVLVAKNGFSDDSANPLLQDSTALEGKLQLRNAPNSETDEVYVTPKFENGSNNGCSNQNLEAVHQAIILAQCLLIDSSSRDDELRKWDMAPFIEAIDSNTSSFVILRSYCNLMRVRWESTRSRTKVRALEIMAQLVESVGSKVPKVSHRIPFCFAVFFPTVPSLKKEYGELLIKCGLVGEAIKIFESLDLWDNLIHCYSLLGKKAAAIDIIKTRLSEMPENPSLWCSLGDVTDDVSCYRKALEVSNDKSVRAKRSLARNAYNRGDFVAAKELWEMAMEMNSLYPDGWFALGAAALKARDAEKAVDAFTRAVQLDPTNGEAWNNIACLHMIRKKSKESCIAFKEALKFKRESWQMWENYSQVAMDVGDFRQALESVQMVLQLTNLKRVDVSLLGRILETIERQCSNDSASSCGENSRETEQMLQSTGKILQQIVKTGGPAEVWGLYAKWHRIKGDLAMCSEALLKLVRSYQGSDLWKDRERFSKFVSAVIELCNVYMQKGNPRELFSAEMLLKNTIKQAEVFSDMEEFKNLENCLSDVKQSISC